jgi:hypothetical protein
MKKTFPDSSSDESQRERLQDQFIACSFAWGCYLFDKVEKESSQLGLDKTAATKVERKLVYLALYLCFLGKKMVDKNR